MLRRNRASPLGGAVARARRRICRKGRDSSRRTSSHSGPSRRRMRLRDDRNGTLRYRWIDPLVSGRFTSSIANGCVDARSSFIGASANPPTRADFNHSRNELHWRLSMFALAIELVTSVLLALLGLAPASTTAAVGSCCGCVDCCATGNCTPGCCPCDCSVSSSTSKCKAQVSPASCCSRHAQSGSPAASTARQAACSCGCDCCDAGQCFPGCCECDCRTEE
jgi:hypothetical protein